MKKLAIVTTHPIQYNAPLFQLLHQRGNVEIMVFYTWGVGVMEKKYDPGFGKIINWDIPLLAGYPYRFVANTSKAPGSGHFNGIVNPTLNTEIRDWGADAILVYGWSFKSHLACLRHFHGKIPVYFRGDSTLMDEQAGIKKMMRKLFLSWVYRNVDSAFYVGQNNKVYYKAYGLKDAQLQFAGHAVDNDRFAKADTTEVNLIRQKCGLAPAETLFVFAGKLEPKKAPELLIKSFIALKNNNARLLIVGNGVLEETLKKKYAGMPGIHFMDFQNQSAMPALYHAADVFVLPSQGPGETWGLAINEAMAAGKPVLVSDACGAAIDLVEHGYNGFICKHNQQDDLREHMNFLMNKNMQATMGKHSRDKIQSWSYESIASALEAAIR
ncbi:MAG: glycosyltransferase [Ferruginibacter sp.]|nr:glycosyltransferase [Ferruginibacter sp.]